METIIEKLTVFAQQMRWAVSALFRNTNVLIPYDSYFFWVLLGFIFTCKVIDILKKFKKVRV